MEAPLRILILEDSLDDASLIERALRDAGVVYSAKRVATREDFARGLHEWSPDLILSDYRLPHFDGLAALKLAREALPGTPTIIVSGTLSDEAAVGLLREGACDYVLKDRLSRLGAAVRRAIDAARSDAAQREAQERQRLLFDEARDGIALIDCATGRIVEANAELQRQAGRGIDALKHLPIWQLASAAMVEAQRQRFLTLANDRGANDWQLDLLRPDGTELPVELRTKRVELRAMPYVLVTSRDISERRTAERLLQGQLDELRRFQRVTVDRELRMQEVEEELRRLKLKAGP
jgi:PAS domain S-box-containing protein